MTQTKILKLVYTKVDEGFYRVETPVRNNTINGKDFYYPIAILTQNNYGNKYWQIEYLNKRFVDDNGYDCFTFSIARKLLKENIALDTGWLLDDFNSRGFLPINKIKNSFRDK